jgi:hypothetical protein
VNDDGLIAHWPLRGDARDTSGHGNHGRAHAVDFSAEGPEGEPGTAARLDGCGAAVEVPHAESLRLGTGNFTVTAWVRAEEVFSGPAGDVLSKWDADARRGFGLAIHGSSAGYNGMGDARNVHFGIDAAMDHPWEDRGKPWPSNTYVSSLTVWRGSLYAGIADAVGEKWSACRVFRYAGGEDWEDCGRVGDSLRTHSAYSMVVHGGELFCGTGRYDWWSVGPDECDPVRVYRYAGGQEWLDCGQPGVNYRVLSLASFQGSLYAGTDAMAANPDAGKVHRWVGGTEWEDCGRLGEQYSVFALCAFRGRLYGGTQWGEVYRYEGEQEWTYIGRPFANDQVHCLQVYRGGLYAGTWPDGIVARWEGGHQWSHCGALGGVVGHTYGETDTPQVSAINEVNELTVYNGKLYAGVIPKGEVYRYEGGREWTMVRRLVSAPDYNPDHTDGWSRVPCMTVYRGRLFAGTSTCRGVADANPHHEVGRVYSTMAGQAVSHDDDLGSGWHHLAAVRSSGRLSLWVDGRPVAESEPFPGAGYNLDCEAPLRLGAGEWGTFHGSLADVRLYGRALDEDEICRSAAHDAAPRPAL